MTACAISSVEMMVTAMSSQAVAPVTTAKTTVKAASTQLWVISKGKLRLQLTSFGYFRMLWMQRTLHGVPGQVSAMSHVQAGSDKQM